LGQPVLVGTVSVDKSEALSARLKREGIEHTVLNAKYHEKEAEIVAQAGRLGAVTISTNMAGRGTDILLGGNPEFLAKKDMQRQGYDDDTIGFAVSSAQTEDTALNDARNLYRQLYAKHKEAIAPLAKQVCDAGGLFIIGTERHESRRIDNQLRGRSGRQGDPGASRFYIALEDDLMRLFGGERVKMMMDRLSGGEELLLEYGSEEKEASLMAKGMSWMKTSMKMTMDNSSATVADLITDGCNMGIKSLYRYMNQYPAANEKVKDIIEKLIEIEDELRRDLKAYL